MPDERLRLLRDLADPVRLGAVERLERGPASASELAAQLAVSPTQLANHLRRLREHGLVTVHKRGRHAVYELAEPGLRELLSIVNGLTGEEPATERRGSIAAGTCYDHLSGRLGVALFDALVEQGALIRPQREGRVELGPDADAALERYGVTVPADPGRRMLAYACLDSGEGRHHLGGALGAEVADTLIGRGWLERVPGTRRLAITRAGRRGLKRLLGHEVAA